MGSRAGLSFFFRKSSSFRYCSWLIVGAEVTSPSSSENSSYSSFLPLHTTYCIGLKEISLLGNTAKRNAPCRTAENNRRYPLLSAFACVPSGFVSPKLRKSIYACKWSAVTLFSFRLPMGCCLIRLTVP